MTSRITLLKCCLILQSLIFNLQYTAAQQYNFRTYSLKEGMAQSQVLSMCYDSRGRIWFGTYGSGVCIFDGTNWTAYNTINSDLPTDYINSITIDSYGNKWIGTVNGLAVFREGGVIGTEETEKWTETNMTIYPNPVNETAFISYQLPSNTLVTIEIYDMLGNKVKELVNEQKPKGTYKIQFDASYLKNGLYIGSIKTEREIITKKFTVIR